MAISLQDIRLLGVEFTVRVSQKTKFGAEFRLSSLIFDVKKYKILILQYSEPRSTTSKMPNRHAFG